jgi:hypothetical protein
MERNGEAISPTARKWSADKKALADNTAVQERRDAELSRLVAEQEADALADNEVLSWDDPRVRNTPDLNPNYM